MGVSAFCSHGPETEVKWRQEGGAGRKVCVLYVRFKILFSPEGLLKGTTKEEKNA